MERTPMIRRFALLVGMMTLVLGVLPGSLLVTALWSQES
ncbi:uncharacterized protein METZ01_LOCUS485002, partial [marine metagenome]